MGAISPWTDKEVDLLKTFWDRNWSAEIIAEEFGKLGYKFTRNSVVGKLHRLGLSKKDRQVPGQAVKIMTKRGLQTFGGRPKRIRHPTQSQFKKQPIPPKAQRPDEGKSSYMGTPRADRRVLLIDTNETHCRAIVGYEGGQAARAVCCGEVTAWSTYKGVLRRLSWCEHHRKLYLTEPHR